MKTVYLDHAAATPLNPTIAKAMADLATKDYYNPSAIYLPAQQAKQKLMNARKEVALVLGARDSEIVFTSGGTEANNMVIQGVMRAYPQKSIVISSIEHDSVYQPARRFNLNLAKVGPDGRLDLSDLTAKITDDTVLISVMYASNEVGTVQPISDVAELIKQIRISRLKSGNDLPLYFHTDACQAANYLDLNVSRLGVDFMTLNGGKIYGPKNSGVLYIKAGTKLEPLLSGGGQEFGLRSGTENLASAVGFAMALNDANSMRKTESRRLIELRDFMIERLKNSGNRVDISGSLKFRLPNNVHITIEGQDNERLIFELDQLGFLVAAGSACSAAKQTPSRTLLAMGKTEKEARSSLRLTLGRATKKADLVAFLLKLNVLISK
jgi:cysteine desulfurase